MDVLDLRRQIVDDYATFARSVPRIKADDLRRQVDSMHSGDQFRPEPLLQISPHFRPDAFVDELIARPTFSRRPPGPFALPMRPRWDCASTRIERVQAMPKPGTRRTPRQRRRRRKTQ